MKRIIRIIAVSLAAAAAAFSVCACGNKSGGTDSTESAEVYVVPEVSKQPEQSSAPEKTKESSAVQNSGKGLFTLREAVEAAGGLKAFTKDITVPDYEDNILIEYALTADDQLEVTMVLKEYIDPTDQEVQKLFRTEFERMRPAWTEQIRAAEAKNTRPFTISVKSANSFSAIFR